MHDTFRSEFGNIVGCTAWLGIGTLPLECPSWPGMCQVYMIGASVNQEHALGESPSGGLRLMPGLGPELACVPAAGRVPGSDHRLTDTSLCWSDCDLVGLRRSTASGLRVRVSRFEISSQLPSWLLGGWLSCLELDLHIHLRHAAWPGVEGLMMCGSVQS